MKGFTNSLNSMKVGLIGVFGTAAVGAFVRNTLQSADAIGKFSDRIGISTTALQEWRFAFDKAGLSASEVDKGLLNFVKNLGEARQGTGTLVTFLNKYDKSLLQVLQSENDNTRALEVLFKALGKTENQADKVALANAALGRSGKQMVAAFKNGTASFDNWIKRGRELGVVIDDKLIRGAEDLNDEISTLSTTITTQLQSAFLSLAPQIEASVKALIKFSQLMKELNTPSTLGFFEKLALLTAAGTLEIRKGFFEKLGLKELAENAKKMQDEVFKILSQGENAAEKLDGKVSLEKKAPVLPSTPERTDDSGIKTLLETIDLTDILVKKRAAEFEKMFERATEQKALDREVSSQLEREIKLLTIQASGNKELFALKQLQFEIQDRLGRQLDEDDNRKLKLFAAEKSRLEAIVAENEKTGQQITEIWEAVGRGTEDAIVNALTGATSAMEGFRNIAMAILEDITRQIIRTSLITPLFGKEGGVLSSIKSFLPGFAHGGGFTVPGSGGTDSSPVSFMATPGERVDIRTPGQVTDGQGQNITIVQNIQTGVAQTVRAEMLSIMPLIIERAKQGVFDTNRRGGNFSRA